MLPEELLSRYGLLENYTSGVMGTETGTTEVTTNPLYKSCSRAKKEFYAQFLRISCWIGLLGFIVSPSTRDATFFYIVDQKQAHTSRAGMDCGKLTLF